MSLVCAGLGLGNEEVRYLYARRGFDLVVGVMALEHSWGIGSGDVSHVSFSGAVRCQVSSYQKYSIFIGSFDYHDCT